MAIRLLSLLTQWVSGEKLYAADLNDTLDAITSKYFGDGSDGDVVISTNTTLVRDMYYNNLTINANITLNTGNFKIFVKNNLTVNTGSKIVASLLGNGSGGQNLTGDSSWFNTARGGNAIGGGDGGDGYNKDNNGSATQVNKRAAILTSYDILTLMNTTLSWGGGGGGGGYCYDSYTDGGAGGSGAGLIFLIAKNIIGALVLEAKGQNGFNAGSSGGGGGGGFIVCGYRTKTSTISTDVSGGTSPTHGATGNGFNGSAGNAHILIL